MKRKGRFAAYILLVVLSVLSLAAKAQYDTVQVEPLESAPVEDNTVSGNSHNYFEEKTGPEEVQERPINRTVVRKLKAQDDYWYADRAPKKVEKPKETPQWVYTLFWIFAVGIFLAVLIWFLASSNIRLFSRNRTIRQDGEEIPGLEEDIHSIDFEKEIQKAVNEGNLRLAVRLHYLQVLRLLADRQMINYTHEKTNSAYLFQLADSPLYRDFFRLTRNFEYIWYGMFHLAPEQFGLVQKEFTAFKTRLGS